MVKKFVDDTSLPWPDRYAALDAHHIEETTELVEKLRMIRSRSPIGEAEIEPVCEALIKPGADVMAIVRYLAGLVGIERPELFMPPADKSLGAVDRLCDFIDGPAWVGAQGSMVSDARAEVAGLRERCAMRWSAYDAQHMRLVGELLADRDAAKSECKEARLEHSNAVTALRMLQAAADAQRDDLRAEVARLRTPPTPAPAALVAAVGAIEPWLRAVVVDANERGWADCYGSPVNPGEYTSNPLVAGPPVVPPLVSIGQARALLTAYDALPPTPARTPGKEPT